VSRERIGAIVQARTGSSRLPRKVLLELAGKPLLLHVLDRLARARELDAIVVATSAEPADDAVAALCAAHGTPCVRGPHEDVAARVALAAREHRLDAFVRVSGDSPLIDPAIVDRAVARYRAGDADLVTNVRPRSFPPGQSVEVVRTLTFLSLVPRMTTEEEREHVTPLLYESGLRIARIEASRDYGDLALTVDTAEDLARLDALIRRVGPDASLDEIGAAA
jgi:spore coat polysaccharide biosynthesis protein SpsF (cytidylyltransferase family)